MITELKNIFTKEKEKWVSEILSSMPFVKWDRFTDNQDNPRILTIFDWIDREDDYKDFVVLEFNITEVSVYFVCTSSKGYSEKIAKILGSSHTDCKRVEAIFDLENCVKINEGKR